MAVWATDVKIMRIINHWLLSCTSIKQNFDKVCPTRSCIIIIINASES